MTDTNIQSYNLGNDDDGFSGGSGRARGSFLSWNIDWKTSDRVDPPPLLVGIRMHECLRRWQDHVPTDITDQPLPDPDELNAKIPTSEWELGVDGRPRPPWEHTVVIRFVDPSTGALYTYASATAGGHIAYEDLQQSVRVMRMLKGAPVLPRVELSERPFKTKFGMKTRPHFEIVGWETPGGSMSLPAAPPALQLPGAVAPLSEPEPAAAIVDPVPAAETAPPRGGRGRATIISGKQGGKSKIREDTERRRPDLRQDLRPGPDDDIPF